MDAAKAGGPAGRGLGVGVGLTVRAPGAPLAVRTLTARVRTANAAQVSFIIVFIYFFLSSFFSGIF